jgi:hypothetical protein
LRDAISSRTRNANAGSAASNSAQEAMTFHAQRNLASSMERPSDPAKIERLRRICLSLPEVT